MKSLVVPVVIITILIVIFCIIDQRDFNHHNDIQTVQNQVSTHESPTSFTETESKPVAESSISKETVKTKTVAEEIILREKEEKESQKPIETKPVAEDIVSGKKTFADSPVLPAEAPDVHFVKNGLFDDPTAIPVVTSEEAENLNNFALFLMNVEETVVEGVVIERSNLPDPTQSDYPNCRFTIHFDGNAIQSGLPCPKELVVILEGFKNYKTLKTEEIKKETKLNALLFLMTFFQMKRNQHNKLMI